MIYDNTLAKTIKNVSGPDWTWDVICPTHEPPFNLAVNILVSYPEILINRGNWGRSIEGDNVFEARNRSWESVCYPFDVTLDPTKLPDYY